MDHIKRHRGFFETIWSTSYSVWSKTWPSCSLTLTQIRQKLGGAPTERMDFYSYFHSSGWWMLSDLSLEFFQNPQASIVHRTHALLQFKHLQAHPIILNRVFCNHFRGFLGTKRYGIDKPSRFWDAEPVFVVQIPIWTWRWALNQKPFQQYKRPARVAHGYVLDLKSAASRFHRFETVPRPLLCWLRVSDHGFC